MPFFQIRYEATKQKLIEKANLKFLLKIINFMTDNSAQWPDTRYPAGYPVLQKPETGYSAKVNISSDNIWPLEIRPNPSFFPLNLRSAVLF